MSKNLLQYCSKYTTTYIYTMIVSITSLKGGVGKSTIAQNLSVCFAHAGYKTCIVDADTNQSALRWSGFRSAALPAVPVFGIPDGSTLTANLKPLHKDYEIVIIDGTPSLSKLTSRIIVMADLLIIPTLPSGLDLWATEQFLERYRDAVAQKEMPIPARFLLNRYRPNTNFSKEVKAVLSDTDIPVLANSIKDRVAYAEAVVNGLGVYEYKNEKAKTEFAGLFNEINEIISKL
jgi:chromosome partitioning protein